MNPDTLRTILETKIIGPRARALLERLRVTDGKPLHVRPGGDNYLPPGHFLRLYEFRTERLRGEGLAIAQELADAMEDLRSWHGPLRLLSFDHGTDRVVLFLSPHNEAVGAMAYVGFHPGPGEQ